MKFSTQEEYGLRCLIAIARQGPGGSLTIPELSKIEGLSASHVAKLLSILRKAGFIRSTRGQTGGYSLGKPTEGIMVGDVLAELGGRLYDRGFCDRHSGLEPDCVHLSNCALRSLWGRIQGAVDEVLYNLTLKDILDHAMPTETDTIHLQSSPQRKSPGTQWDRPASN